MFLRTDTMAGVDPRILRAIAEASAGEAQPYGDDDWTRQVDAAFAAVFGRDVHVVPVVSGTAANAVAIATFADRFGAVLCHEAAHIRKDEANAVGFFSPGLETIGIAGEHGRIDAASLAHCLDGLDPRRPADPRPVGISLTQATEDGTVYSPPQVAAIGQLAHDRGLILHMDGARLANAVAGVGCSLAEMTWQAGVDILSFGGTKNGTMCADAVVVFDPNLADDIDRIRKRGGLLLAKQRFLSVQLLAYLRDGVWRENAARANALATALAQGLQAIEDIDLLHPVEANEVFIALPQALLAGFAAAGYPLKSRRAGEGRVIVRLVPSFGSDDVAIAGFVDTARRLMREI